MLRELVGRQVKIYSVRGRNAKSATPAILEAFDNNWICLRARHGQALYFSVSPHPAYIKRCLKQRSAPPHLSVVRRGVFVLHGPGASGRAWYWPKHSWSVPGWIVRSYFSHFTWPSANR